MAKEHKNEEDDDDGYSNLKLINLKLSSRHHPQKSNQWGSKHDLDLQSIAGKIFKQVSSPRNHYNNFNASIHNRISAINKKHSSNNGGRAILLPKHTRKSSPTKKLRYQGTDRNLNLRLLGINFDSQFGLDAEERDISQLDLEFERSVLTVAGLESVLKESPTVVHVSTHGSHHYKAVNKENEFQISFEETHILRALIDEDRSFSAYYAVIALLFEMEMNHFVQYGFKHGEKHNKSLRTYIWCDETKFALLTNSKIYGMFGSILDRFGMHYRDARASNGFIEIYWGQYSYETHNKLIYVAPPHAPMDAYQLKTLYNADENVQEILKEINDDYNRSMAHNVKIAKSLQKHQKFSWEILSILLHRKLMEKSAEPNDKDDTQWMVEEKERRKYLKVDRAEDVKSTLLLPQLSENKHEEDDTFGGDAAADPDITAEEYADFFGSESDDDDDDDDPLADKIEQLGTNEFVEDSSFFDDDDECRTTAVKFGKMMDLIREIKIIPINIDRTDLNNDPSEMEQLIERVSLFKDRLVKSIKKIAGIEIQLSQRSHSSSNIHIMQFANKYALREAQKKVDKICANSKYNHDYDIEFRPISKADDSTKKQVGFVKRMQEKVYRIDVVRKTDPISLMLKKHLRSRDECKIKLLVLNGCHSFILGKIFSEYVENVICIHPFVKIWDSTAITFTRYFYQSLQEYTNPSTPFRQSVLKSYNTAKRQVAKECPNDNACGSHSHSHPYRKYPDRRSHNHNIQRIRHKQQQFNQLHLSENWNELQNHMNDPIKFAQYRLEMQKSGVSTAMDDDLGDIYDDQTLILSNLSKDTMHELVQYLEDLTDDTHFVERAVYQKNEHYEEFSVAYLKFKSKSDRIRAIKLLNKKQRDEELEFSDRILFGGKHIIKMHSAQHSNSKQYSMDDFKADMKSPHNEYIDECARHLGWYHRVVPPCCCSPHHPHVAQDKLILLQDGYIINRELIHNVTKIKKGLAILKQRRKKRRLKLQAAAEQKMPELNTEYGADSSRLSSYSDDVGPKTPKKRGKKKKKKRRMVNTFGDDDDDAFDEDDRDDDEVEEEEAAIVKNIFPNEGHFGDDESRQQNIFQNTFDGGGGGGGTGTGLEEQVTFNNHNHNKQVSMGNNFEMKAAKVNFKKKKRVSGNNNFGFETNRVHKKKNTFVFDDINEPKRVLQNKANSYLMSQNSNFSNFGDIQNIKKRKSNDFNAHANKF